MARTARRYDIYLPTTYNDGTPIQREKFRAVEVALLERFGGLQLFGKKIHCGGYGNKQV